MFRGFLLILLCVLAIADLPDDEEINLNKTISEPSRKQLFRERLRAILIISSISVGIMVLIVCGYIIQKYLADKRRTTRQTEEQQQPLQSARK